MVYCKPERSSWAAIPYHKLRSGSRPLGTEHAHQHKRVVCQWESAAEKVREPAPTPKTCVLPAGLTSTSTPFTLLSVSRCVKEEEEEEEEYF